MITRYAKHMILDEVVPVPDKNTHLRLALSTRS